MAKKIYLAKFESCVDGEPFFSVTPCATEEIAQKCIKEEKEWIFKHVHHWANVLEVGDESKRQTLIDNGELEFVDTPNRFFVNDLTADYHEEYTIQEKNLKVK